MTSTKIPDTSPYHQPLLSNQTQPPQYVVVLQPYPPPHHHHHRILRKSCRRCIISGAAALLFIIAVAYLLWPSDPELSIVRMSLDRLHFHTSPKISLDVTLDLTVKVRNKDLYSIDYDSLMVAIGYKGKRLGFVNSAGGKLKARGSSYVNATLLLEGVEILSDAILLVEDLAKGAITFDTETRIEGRLRVFFFDLPLKTTVSCEVIVNTRNQTISRQNCYPEVSEVS